MDKEPKGAKIVGRAARLLWGLFSLRVISRLRCCTGRRSTRWRGRGGRSEGGRVPMYNGGLWDRLEVVGALLPYLGRVGGGGASPGRNMGGGLRSNRAHRVRA